MFYVNLLFSWQNNPSINLPHKLRSPQVQMYLGVELGLLRDVPVVVDLGRHGLAAGGQRQHGHVRGERAQLVQRPVVVGHAWNFFKTNLSGVVGIFSCTNAFSRHSMMMWRTLSSCSKYLFGGRFCRLHDVVSHIVKFKRAVEVKSLAVVSLETRFYYDALLLFFMNVLNSFTQARCIRFSIASLEVIS